MIRTSTFAYFTLTALAASGLALAQDPQSAPPDPQYSAQPNSPQNNGNHGWRRVDDAAQADVAGSPDQDPGTPAPPPPPASRQQQPGYYSGQPAPPPNYGAYPGANTQGYPQNAPPAGNYGRGSYQGPPPNYQQGPPPNYQPNYQQGAPNYQQAPPPPQAPIPASLTIKPGTYITVRVNQVLSSDHNHAGDAFSATLVRPIVVNGVVVAEHGQTIGGRVAETKKAGMVEGTSKLGVQLTDLTLVDGQNIPIQSQLISRNGSTSVGRDAGAVAGTTALGAAVGASADWGRGAAMGAGAGAAAGLIGVLLTRGHPTVIYPEQVLTFRLESPVTVATDRAPQAFRYVEPGDYQQAELQRRPPPTLRSGPPTPYFYTSPYYYGPGYYPYAYGPSIGFYFGGRGYYRGWRR